PLIRGNTRKRAPGEQYVGTVETVEPAGEVAIHEESLRPSRLENAGNAFVDAGDRRGHGDHHCHPDRYAQDGQGCPDLVCLDRVQCNGRSFHHAGEQSSLSLSLHSALSASIGSSRDARLAGYTPAAMPTLTPSTTATRMDQGATAAGNGVTAFTTNARAMPSPIPKAAPTAESVADPTTNWARMSRRRAPSAFRMPISRVRSLTAISMMFMITIPPTTREIATRPGSARNRILEIFSQVPSAPCAV